MARTTQFFGEIRRFDEEQRMVWGYASTEQRAVDGKIIRRCAMERALDDYMEFANIREMHQPSAVGVAREAHVDEGGLYIGAHVVDDQAWEKVKTGVYRAFSIRAKPTAYDPLDPTAITDMLIREISLVDRPGDAGTKFDCFRAADFGEDDDLDTPINAAAPVAEEDDMSRAAAKKPAPAAAPDAGAQTAPQDDLERAAQADTAAEAEAPAEGAAEVEAAAPAEEASAEAPVTEAEVAPEIVDDPVARAVEGAAAAIQKVEDAVEAVERAASGDAPVPACIAAGMEVRRGISTVGRLGYLLSEFAYIIFEADFDKEIEGDASTVPAKLRTALGAMAVAYKAMSDEELAELLKSAGVEGAVERALIALTVSDDELQRSADEEIGTGFAGRLQTLFDGFISRGWAPVPPAGEDDELVRQVAALTSDRTTLLGTVEALTARMDRMGETITRLADATAMPPKTAGTLARSVDKEEDAAGAGAAAPRTELSTDDIQRVLGDMPEDERALLITRAALTRPIAIASRTASKA